jgi:hypothetical protein
MRRHRIKTTILVAGWFTARLPCHRICQMVGCGLHAHLFSAFAQPAPLAPSPGITAGFQRRFLQSHSSGGEDLVQLFAVPEPAESPGSTDKIYWPRFRQMIGSVGIADRGARNESNERAVSWPRICAHPRFAVIILSDASISRRKIALMRD